MEVSSLDLRILRYSLEHGLLASEREIARKLKISPSTLSFKFRKFEDRGIITAYRYRVDFAKLGLGQIAWIFVKLRFGGKSIRKVMDSFLEHPEVHVCLYTSGRYNLALKVYGRSREEIGRFAEKILTEHRSEVVAHKTSFVEKVLKSHNMECGDGKKIAADETDIAILSEKMVNPKSSLNDVAKKLKLHRNTVSARWKKLLDGKVVVKKTPIINPELHRAIGIYFMAVNLIKSRPKKQHALCTELLSMNEVHELNVMDAGSKYDIIAILRTNDMNSYYTLLNNSVFGAKKISGAIMELNSKIILSSDSRRHTYLKDLGMEKILEKN